MCIRDSCTDDLFLAGKRSEFLDIDIHREDCTQRIQGRADSADQLSLIHIYGVQHGSGHSLFMGIPCGRIYDMASLHDAVFLPVRYHPVSYTHLDVYKRQVWARSA